MKRYLILGIGDTKFWFYLRVVQFVYFFILVGFLLDFFVVYRPYKIHRICADSSAKEVLQMPGGDSFGMYQSLYSDCVAKTSSKLTF